MFFNRKMNKTWKLTSLKFALLPFRRGSFKFFFGEGVGPSPNQNFQRHPSLTACSVVFFFCVTVFGDTVSEWEDCGRRVALQCDRAVSRRIDESRNCFLCPRLRCCWCAHNWPVTLPCTSLILLQLSERLHQEEMVHDEGAFGIAPYCFLTWWFRLLLTMQCVHQTPRSMWVVLNSSLTHGIFRGPAVFCTSGLFALLRLRFLSSLCSTSTQLDDIFSSSTTAPSPFLSPLSPLPPPPSSSRPPFLLHLPSLLTLASLPSLPPLPLSSPSPQLHLSPRSFLSSPSPPLPSPLLSSPLLSSPLLSSPLLSSPCFLPSSQALFRGLATSRQSHFPFLFRLRSLLPLYSASRHLFSPSVDALLQFTVFSALSSNLTLSLFRNVTRVEGALKVREDVTIADRKRPGLLDPNRFTYSCCTLHFSFDAPAWSYFRPAPHHRQCGKPSRLGSMVSRSSLPHNEMHLWVPPFASKETISSICFWFARSFPTRAVVCPAALELHIRKHQVRHDVIRSPWVLRDGAFHPTPTFAVRHFLPLFEFTFLRKAPNLRSSSASYIAFLMSFFFPSCILGFEQTSDCGLWPQLYLQLGTFLLFQLPRPVSLHTAFASECRCAHSSSRSITIAVRFHPNVHQGGGVKLSRTLWKKKVSISTITFFIRYCRSFESAADQTNGHPFLDRSRLWSCLLLPNQLSNLSVEGRPQDIIKMCCSLCPLWCSDRSRLCRHACERCISVRHALLVVPLHDQVPLALEEPFFVVHRVSTCARLGATTSQTFSEIHGKYWPVDSLGTHRLAQAFIHLHLTTLAPRCASLPCSFWTYLFRFHYVTTPPAFDVMFWTAVETHVSMSILPSVASRIPVRSYAASCDLLTRVDRVLCGDLACSLLLKKAIGSSPSRRFTVQRLQYSSPHKRGHRTEVRPCPTIHTKGRDRPLQGLRLATDWRSATLGPPHTRPNTSALFKRHIQNVRVIFHPTLETSPKGRLRNTEVGTPQRRRYRDSRRSDHSRTLPEPWDCSGRETQREKVGKTMSEEVGHTQPRSSPNVSWPIPFAAHGSLILLLLLLFRHFLFFANSSSFLSNPFFASLHVQIHVSLFFRSFPLDSSDSSYLKNSLISSSHLFLGLPTGLFVLTLLMRPGFHSAAFLDHRSSGKDASLIANLHFIFLCDSIQQEILLTSFALRLLLCFSLCNRSTLPLRFQFHLWLCQNLSWRKHHWIDHNLNWMFLLLQFLLHLLDGLSQSELSASCCGPSSLLFFCIFSLFGRWGGASFFALIWSSFHALS